MNVQGFRLLEDGICDFEAEFLRPGTVFKIVITQAWFRLAAEN